MLSLRSLSHEIGEHCRIIQHKATIETRFTRTSHKTLKNGTPYFGTAIAAYVLCKALEVDPSTQASVEFYQGFTVPYCSNPSCLLHATQSIEILKPLPLVSGPGCRMARALEEASFAAVPHPYQWLIASRKVWCNRSCNPRKQVYPRRPIRNPVRSSRLR
ncbi:hypothetical protein EDB86DRAFT_2068399 [Lactarius hatsudake]|nr:hypothetical protein EDB86DRAFT_2068399 [Lactarius hatsudake]